MMFEDVFEEVRPYLSDPRGVRDFLEGLEGKERDVVIAQLEKMIGETEPPLKTDFRILFSALMRRG